MTNQVYDPRDGQDRPVEIIQPDQLPALNAEVHQAIATARAFPRRPDATLMRIMKERCTISAEAAEESVYSLPRGNKELVGPSIRFAENIMGVYGNCRVGAEYVGVDRAEKLAIVRGTFWDLETNSMTQRVEARRCSTKNGAMFSPDMIAMTIKAGISIAARNAILAGIPKAIWSEAYYAANGLIIGDVKEFPKRLEKSISAFAELGVSLDDVIAMLDITGRDAMRPNHLPIMRGLFNSLRDGSETVQTIIGRRKNEGGSHAEVGSPLADKPAETDGPAKNYNLYAAADYIIGENGNTVKDAGEPEPRLVLDYSAMVAYCDKETETGFAQAALAKQFRVASITEFNRKVDASPAKLKLVATDGGQQGTESGPGVTVASGAPPAAPKYDGELPPPPKTEREYAVYARAIIKNSKYNTARAEEILLWFNGPQQKSLRNKCFVSPELAGELRAEIEGGA